MSNDPPFWMLFVMSPAGWLVMLVGTCLAAAFIDGLFGTNIIESIQKLAPNR